MITVSYNSYLAVERRIMSKQSDRQAAGANSLEVLSKNIKYLPETKQNMKTRKITALYCRLSRDDEQDGLSGSIKNQDELCQGVFLPKYIKAAMREL